MRNFSLRRGALLWMFFAACGAIGAFTAGGLAQPERQPAATAAETQGPSLSAAPESGKPGTAMSDELARRRAAEEPSSPLQRAVSFLGLLALIGLCYVFSRDRKAVNWTLVAWGLGLQILFGYLVLATNPGRWFFSKLNDGTMALLGFTQEGTNFLFRSFVTGQLDNSMVNFTFNVLPTIIFFSSLRTVLYYLGVMQRIVLVFAVVMQKTMRTSGAETLSTAANIFVGQTEAPLVIKPYVHDMTPSELMAVMVGGFANTAGGVLAAYVGMLHQYFPDIAGHLIAQSVMSAPAALVCAKIVYPEDGKPRTAGEKIKMIDEKIDANVIDAASRGASEGMTLALNVAAMLLAFIALIAMANALFRWAGGLVGMGHLSIELILGYAAWPLAWVMGVPSADCLTVGKLIGVKTVVNEFVAYLQMAELLKSGSPLSYR
ncbi:MAG: hypothetical protein HY551_07155, partial [Elusimicrobia bacterium]|nr:hypothetical protein [Elusimicrobiota bacterium]